MHEQERLTPQQSKLANALGALIPYRPDLPIGQIWLEAQRRNARSQVFVWRGVAALLAAGLIVSLLLKPQRNSSSVVQAPIRPSSQVIRQTPRENTPGVAREPLPIVLTGDDYVALRSRVLAFGLHALPPPTTVQTHFTPIRPIDAFIRYREPRSEINFFGPLWRGGHS